MFFLLVPFTLAPPIVSGPVTIADAQSRQEPLVQEAINYDEATAHINSASTDCSVMSLYSFNSERDADSFVHESGGRRYNTRNELYALPSDPPEFARQYVVHCLALQTILTARKRQAGPYVAARDWESLSCCRPRRNHSESIFSSTYCHS